MATIRKFKDKKKVIETEIDGFYIRSLTISESKEIVKAHSTLTEDDLINEELSQKLTMQLFGLACDEHGEAFDEFSTYDEVEKLSLEEFNMFANAIKNALVPGASSEKKS
ncbi:MAG: hypothetical protein ACK4KU_14525 [Acinetobacter sp.]|uniref:hypothetical protein n=1 Tax=Acinetobacter sp. TaxID=472 RepID=UPI00391C714D